MLFPRNQLLLPVILVALSFAPARAVEPVIIEHGPRGSKMVALTFDACPTTNEDEYDERVVEVLMQEQVPATLFMSGRWVEKNEEKAKFLAAQPQFEIANHAYRHPHMLEKDDERIMRELKRTQGIIHATMGAKPLYFRPPFGEVDERLAKLAAQAGLVTVQYDIASGDPDAGLSAKRIARSVVADVKGGSIVVFHMNGNGPHTAESLPEVIRGLRERGFELVTVGEMLKKADAGTGRQGDRERRKSPDVMTSATVTAPIVSAPSSTELPASIPTLSSAGTDTTVDTAPTGTSPVQPGMQ